MIVAPLVEYRVASTPNPPLGVGGLPRARPYFLGDAENGIRHPGPCHCCAYAPGPNVPEHWYDGGMGWVSRYFTDVEPFDWNAKSNGKHVCQVPVANGKGTCQHPIQNDGCCDKTFCWCPCAKAPPAMRDHLQSAHGIVPPPLRGWASDLFDTEGCMDTIFCTPCHGARQMMALSGYADTFNIWWCLFFCFAGCRSRGRHETYWVPPCTMVAIFTRFRMVALNRIDENPCQTCMTVLCCPACSVAQTYRELSASGVWPGGNFNSAPPLCVMKPFNTPFMK
jgi:Cys-rich protein (TIGR01571 family)